MAWKIDLRKAYDTVCWDFLFSMLLELKFPLKFIALIKMCVSSTTFSILINGEMVDYFEGKRRMRQGDPLSPFLFTIVMEYLSQLLGKLDRKAGFYHHPKCHKIELKHILFADDLMLFSSGRPSSILTIKTVINNFLKSLGLAINLSKSQIFIGGMSAEKRSWVEQTLGTAVTRLPIRYLGIPINSKSICSRDCTTLIDIITSRIHAGSTRFLSRAGRRLLIQSVLHSIVSFWARMCILPKKFLHAVASICTRFFWKGNTSGRGNHLVCWKDVCNGKAEEGLGFKDLIIMNDAVRLNQLWGLSNGRRSI
ncbi:unnamed protein product [Rhodiola kirilowii]